MSETFVPSRYLDPTNNPYQNLLINGGFEQWNGGTLFTTPPDLQNVADGWTVRMIGVTAYTISQEATNIDNGAYSMKINITNAGSGTRLRVGQTSLFANNNVSLIGKQLSLSMRVKSNIAGVTVMTFQSGGNTLSNAHTGDNTWQTLSLKVTPSGAGLSVHVGFDASVGTVSPANGIFYVDSAILTFGTTTPTFMPDNSEIELLKTGTGSTLQSNLTNILINGGFEQWSRGTAFAEPVDNVQCMDGWFLNRSGVTSLQVLQEASNIDSNGNYSCNIKILGTPGTGNCFLSQNINISRYKGKTLSASVRIKTTFAGQVVLMLYDGSITLSNYHSGSGNWETLSCTKSITASPGFLQIYIGFLSANVTTVGSVYIDNAIVTVGTQIPVFQSDPVEVDLLKTGIASAFQANSQNANLLTNPSFNIWQRGTSFSNQATQAYSSDKWQVEINGAAPTYTVSKETVNTDNFSPAALKLQITVTNGNHLYMYQAIENYAAYAGQVLTFSVRVKTNATTISAFILDGVTSTLSSFHTGDNTWQTLTVSKGISSSTSLIWLCVGFGVSGQQQTSITYIDNATLVAGVIPLPYYQPHVADEFARCLRYYEVSNPRYYNVSGASRNAGVNYFNYYTIPFTVSKSALPTMTYSSFSCAFLHLPTTGNTSSTDTANWTPTLSSGLKGFYLGMVRTGDQTTYPLLEVEFDWVAAVT